MTADPTGPGPDWLDRRGVALVLAAMMTMMSGAAISPALPGIADLFAATPHAETLTRLLVTAPSLAIAVAAPVAGMTADRFGRRPQLLWGALFFAVLGSAGFWMPSLEGMLASRLALGLALAAVMTAQTAMIGDCYAGEGRARFMGVQTAIVGLAGFVFVVVAGALASRGARLPFLIYMAPLAALPFLARALTEPAPRAGGGRVEAPEAGGGSMLRVALIAALTGVYFVAFYLAPIQAPYFVETLGLGAPQSAWLTGATLLFGGVSSLSLGIARARLGAVGALTCSLALMSAGFAALAVADNVAGLVFSGALIGIGGGLAMPSLVAAGLDAAPPAWRGFAMGLITTSIFLGQFLSPLASTPLIGRIGYAGGFAAAAAAFALLAAASALVLAPPAARAAMSNLTARSGRG